MKHDRSIAPSKARWHGQMHPRRLELTDAIHVQRRLLRHDRHPTRPQHPPRQLIVDVRHPLGFRGELSLKTQVLLEDAGINLAGVAPLTDTNPQVRDLGVGQWRCRESNPGPPSLHEGFSVRSPLCLYSDPPVMRTSRCDDPSRCVVFPPTPRPGGRVSPLADAGVRGGDAPGPTARY